VLDRFVAVEDVSMPTMNDDYAEDSDLDGLFDTPDTKTRNKGVKQEEKTKLTEPVGSGAAHTRKESRYTTEEARDAALRKELDSIRNVNNVIERVVGSLEKARANMNVCFDSALPANVIAKIR